MVSIRQAAEIIKDGGVVIIPTETAYALAGDASRKEVVEKIYELKGRPRSKPLPVIVDSLNTIEKFAELNDLAVYLSKHFHPGPLTLVVDSKLDWFPKGIGFRISSNPVTHKIAMLVKLPVVATSANLSGKSTPYSAEEARSYFPELPILDCGRLEKKPVSTIFDTRKRKFYRIGEISRREVLARVTAFDALKRLRASRERVRRAVNLALKVIREIGSGVICGSFAKGTALNSTNDIDVFVLFEKGADLEEELEKLRKKLEKKFKVSVEYAQHPYLKVHFPDFSVEVVLAYKTERGKPVSAADRSIWHVEWVSRNVDVEEAILLKGFAKGIGVYGAELKVEGFSGYALEVLAGLFGFLGALKKFAYEWDEKPFIADPVDEKRDVLASVSKYSFEIMKKASRAYLEQPSLSFFFPEKYPVPSRLPLENTHYLLVFERLSGDDNIVYSQLRRYARLASKAAAAEGHVVFSWNVFAKKKAYILFDILERGFKVVEGPPLRKKEHVERFRKKHEITFETRKRVYAIEKARSFAEVLPSEMPKHIRLVSVLRGREIEGIEELREFLAKVLIGLEPWEV